MSLPWIKKYLPQSSGEVVGQAGISLASSLIRNWSRKSKPIWFYGETGTGKTASALAFAKELGLELIEVNASDSRNKDAIGSLIGGAVKQGSLFGTGKLILVDEVDGLSGTKDRGSIPELLKVVKGSMYPIVITGLDPYDRKFSTLRKACELVEFKSLEYKDIMARLEMILRKEQVSFDESSLKKLAMSAGGDMRAAINDAQTFSGAGKLVIDDSLLGDREKTEKIENALLRVFKTTSAAVAKGAFDNVAEDVDKIMLWADHNLPLEYTKPADIYRAYDALAEADRFLGRIRRWQHYRFYVYAYDLLTAGLAVAKDERYPGVVKYKESDRLLKIWMANQKYLKRKAIAEKVAEKSHCSTKRALADIPFLQNIFLNNPDEAQKVALFYDLNKEEVGWLRK